MSATLKHDSNINGANHDGTNRDGTNRDGTNQHGANQHGANQHGTNQDGAQQPGVDQHSANQNGANGGDWTRQFDLELMTRPEAAEAFERFKTAVFPIGATEQHGPHLPLGTDNVLARELAFRLARRVGAVVLPTLPIGYSWVWRDIPGTVSIDQERLKWILKDVVHSLHRSSGIRRFVVISGHGANSSAMKYAVRELADEIPVQCFHFTYPGVKETAARHARTPMWEGMLHACELETAWMLATRPDLVDMSKAVREYPDTPLTKAYHHSSVPMGALSESGVFGDATAADADAGEVMLQEIVEYMAAVMDGRTPPPSADSQ